MIGKADCSIFGKIAEILAGFRNYKQILSAGEY